MASNPQTPGTKVPGKFSDVPLRVRSWLVIIALFAIALLHPVLNCLFFSVLSLIGMKEYVAMKRAYTPALLAWMLPLAAFQFWTSHQNQYIAFLIGTLGYALLTKIFARKSCSGSPPCSPPPPLASAIIINVFLLGQLPFIARLGDAPAHLDGIKALIFLVVLTELNDVFQYLSGKCFGKRRIAPRISPNKTLEGFLGGLFMTMLLSLALAPLLLPGHNWLFHACLGLLIGGIGFCGDLFISSRKRKAGVKDTGTLIPGHGGLLDRMDSLIFITPVFYCLLRFTPIH